MRRILIAGLLFASLAAPPVRADDPPRTVLRLSESAELSVRPDELRAFLAADARAATAAAAQAAVNRAMTAALERARATAGVTAATGSYQVWRVTDRNVSPQTPAVWQASQTLELTTRDAGPLLDLVGTLQGQGLAVRQLSWRVSRELYRRTREQATEEAVRGLTVRAERMAGLLGLAFDRFASVDLDGSRPPMPVARAMAASMADSAAAPPPPPPVAEAEDVRISATVSAEALLRPR